MSGKNEPEESEASECKNGRLELTPDAVSLAYPGVDRVEKDNQRPDHSDDANCLYIWNQITSASLRKSRFEMAYIKRPAIEIKKIIDNAKTARIPIRSHHSMRVSSNLPP